jgi:hypothetical protein
MKSVEAQLETERQRYIAAETKKGFNEGAILTCWKETVMTGISVEEKLSKAKKLNVVTESSRPRVKRNNGAFAEGSDESRVERAMRVHKMTIREASIFCGLADPGPRAKSPKNFNEGLRDRWKKYMGGLISESDLDQLVERQIEPE